MVECKLVFYLVLLIFASDSHAMPTKPSADFTKIITDLWQYIKNSNFNKDTTVGELDAKISPLLISNHVSKKGMEYLEYFGVPSKTIKSFKWHRYLTLHNKNRKGIKVDGSVSAIRRRPKQAGPTRYNDKKLSQRRMMHQEARKNDVSTLAKRIEQAGLGEETDPHAFIPHEKALGEVWSKKKFTNNLSEYMRIHKGIYDYNLVYGRARLEVRRGKGIARSTGQIEETKSSTSNMMEDDSLAPPAPKLSEEDHPASDSSAQLTFVTQGPAPIRRRRKMIYTSDESDEWMPHLDKGEQKGFMIPTPIQRKRLGSDTGSPSENDTTATKLNGASFTFPIWPSSGKRSRQRITRSRFNVQERPTIAAKSYKGARNSLSGEVGVEEASELQQRPTTAGKTYTGGAISERPTLGRKEYTGTSRTLFPKAATLTIRRPTQQQQQIRSPSRS